MPQKISNAEIVVVVGADAEDVPSSIVEYLVVVVVVVVGERKEKTQWDEKDPTLADKTRTHTHKPASDHVPAQRVSAWVVDSHPCKTKGKPSPPDETRALRGASTDPGFVTHYLVCLQFKIVHSLLI